MALADTAELVIALNLRGDASRGLTNLDRQLRGMRGGLSQVGRGLGQVGAGLDSIATRGAIAAAAGLGAVITTAASFEQAFTGVEKTVDGTDAQLAELEDTLRGMARTMPVAFEELAAIGEAGGALGIARESIDEFVDVVARLAVSTDLSSDQAATALGQLGNVLGLTGSDFEDFADILVALGNDGASTESQIIDLAARFGAAGRAAGLSNEQILTLASTTASMGIEAEAGGGALSRIFNNLTLDMATASDEGQLLAQTLGLSLEDLKRAWEQDAGGVFEDLLARIGELDQFAGAELLSNLGITNVRDINAIRLLSEGIGEYRDQLATAEGATGALATESDKFFGTASAGFAKLKNIGRDALATIAEDDLLPAVNEEINRLATELNKPEVREGLRAFGSDLAEGFRELVTAIRSADLAPLLETMKGAASIAKGAFDLFLRLPEPVKQLALAAIIGNKVTGGALGQIAGGLTGIFKGIRTITAGNVTVIGRNVIGGGGGGPGVVGGAGRLGGLGRILGGGFAVLAAAALAEEFEDEISGFAGDLHDSFLKDNPLAGLNLSDLEWPFGNKNAPDWARLDPEPAGNPFQVGGPGGGGRPAPTAADGSFDRFGAKLDTLATNEVIEHLARTTEIGLKDVGTSFQVGLTTGLDPVGDIATRILARAEDPKAPAVMNEIQGHLAGLEEIQATYLQTGDVTLAAKVQANIDTLNTLIGKTDSHRAVTQYLADQAVSSDAAMLATAARTAAAAERTANKPNPVFDPKITVQNFVSVSATVLQQKLVSLRTTVGGGGFI